MEGVRIEFARNDGGAGRYMLEKKFHLAAAAAGRSETFQVRVCNDKRSPKATFQADNQRVAVAFTFLNAVRVIETCGQQQIFRIQNREPGQRRIALKCRRILTGREPFLSDAFRHFLEGLAKYELHTQ